MILKILSNSKTKDEFLSVKLRVIEDNFYIEI